MNLGNMTAAAAISLGVLSASGSAFAYTYSSYSLSQGETVAISGLPAISGGTTPNGLYYATSIILNGSSGNPSLAVWCLDAYDDLQGSGTYAVKTATIANGVSNFLTTGSNTNGSYISGQALGQIGALVKYGTSNLSNSVINAATQIAIWDVEYNNGSAINSPFSPTDPSVVAEVSTLLTDVNPNTQNHFAFVTNLQEFVAPGNQGMVSAVPLPAALPLFGAALMGLGGLGLRKKAQKAA